MKPALILLCLSLLGTLTFCDGEPEAIADDERVAVERVLNDYVRSIVEENIGLSDSIVARDAAMVNIGCWEHLSWIMGKDDLLNVIADQNALFHGTHIRVIRSVIYLSEDCRTAWAATAWDLQTRLQDDALYVLPLRCSWVLEKQGERWVIVHFHMSHGISSLDSYRVDEVAAVHTVPPLREIQ